MKTQLLGAIALSVSFSSLSAQWVQATPTASPAVRSGSALVTAPSGNLVLFGGNLAFGPTNQTYRYDGTTWTLLTNVGAPSSRSNMDLVYDPNAGVFRMYGGVNQGFIGSTVYDQTWEMSVSGTTATWTQNVIVGTTPGGLCEHTTSFDTAHNVMVVHGGLSDPFFPIDSDQTWEFDGTAWTATATFPATNPGPLERAAMCYHPGLDRTILFGGIDVQGSWNNKTWAYDSVTHTWAELTIAGPKPSARTGPKLAYDSIRGVLVLNGGADPSDPLGNAYVNDTWEFDGASWTKVSTNITGSRLDATMAFMPTRNRMVQFSGINYSTFVQYNDTWEWETSTFGMGCAGTNGTPHLSVNASPRLGQSWTVTASNMNPTFNLGVLVFGFTELPGVDLGVLLGMTGCSGYVTPDVIVSLTAGAPGTASWTWPVVAGTVGDHFAGQALCFDPTVNVFGFTASNAISVTVGN